MRITRKIGRDIALKFCAFVASVLFFAATIVLLCDIVMADDLMLERCIQYEHQVKTWLAEEGASEEYFYLMVAESGCRKGAVSDKGAQGFWQLMPATARNNGCANPHNLECATRAAAKYLRSLEARFDTFEEVIWAYNMGGTNLKRAKRPTAEARSLAARTERIRRFHKGNQKE